MKTIYTSLPIYDSLAKQAYERAKHSGHDKPVPIICPRHRLPSFQWMDGTDGADHIDKIELCDKNYTGAEETVGTDWISHTSYTSFAHTGLEITDAQKSPAGICIATSNSFNTVRGTQIRIVGTLANTGPATEPLLYISGPVGGAALDIGPNDVLLTAISAIANSAIIWHNGTDTTNFTLSGVAITKITGALDITAFFVALPVSHALTSDVYFIYKGNTLKYLLPEGEYYLKITMDTGHVYYSDWFKVDCVYENLITEFINANYDVGFSSSGTIITSAIETGAEGVAHSTSNVLSFRIGEVITLICYLTNTGVQLPFVQILYDYVGVGAWGSTASNQVQLAAGLNIVSLTITATIDTGYLRIINTDTANWSTTEILLIRGFSTKYLTINFHNDCDLGDILYHDGFTQTIWFESETMEPSFPHEEEGIKNGEGRFVRTFGRQIKKYLARTKLMPDFMVDVFHRMKLHDTIELIDLVGDENDVYNLEVEHEWYGEDKYYAKIDLTFDYDEAVVIAGCCNNLI